MPQPDPRPTASAPDAGPGPPRLRAGRAGAGGRCRRLRAHHAPSQPAAFPAGPKRLEERGRGRGCRAGNLRAGVREARRLHRPARLLGLARADRLERGAGQATGVGSRRLARRLRERRRRRCRCPPYRDDDLTPPRSRAPGRQRRAASPARGRDRRAARRVPRRCSSCARSRA